MNRLRLSLIFVCGAVTLWGPSAACAKGVADRVDAVLDQVKTKIKAGDLNGAGKLIQSARKTARRDWESLNKVSYFDAAVHAYRGDFEGAAAIIIARLPAAAKRPDQRYEYWFHNNLMMLRAAQGDVPAALIECYELRTVGDRGTWTMPERQREVQVQLKDFWHRALYLRLRAQQVTGSQRTAILRYAEQARAAYRKLAKKVGGFGDSIAVLDVVFAVHKGDRRAALRAARRVNLKENDDVEDLYLAHMGFDFGGDARMAAKVVEKMRSVEYVSHSNAIMLRWIDREQAARTGKKRWTPRYPTAAP